MKKVLLLAVLSLNTVTAQWEKRFYVDEFGDKTDEGYESIIASGTFSNSATQNSKALYRFVKDTESIVINVFEYESNLATSIEHSLEQVKIKTPSGVVTIKEVFFSKTGALVFSREHFTELNKAISEPGEYVMVFSKSSEYSMGSSYKIKFSITDSKDSKIILATLNTIIIQSIYIIGNDTVAEIEGKAYRTGDYLNNMLIEKIEPRKITFKIGGKSYAVDFGS